MKSDMIIVLGGGISAKGILPFWVEERLEKAAELYFSSQIPKILLSGKGRDDFPVAEAKAMSDYLQLKGIPEEDILREELSRDTIQNAFFSTVIHLLPLGIKSALIITNAFHLERSKMIFDYVCGDKLHLKYISVSDEKIEADLLRRRKNSEAQLITFYNNLFSSFDKGDLRAVHDFIFNPQNKYYKLYRELEKELTGKMVLY
jgi:uncharacterized SAM-binding protein YcdF (DUF218 family)